MPIEHKATRVKTFPGEDRDSLSTKEALRLRELGVKLATAFPLFPDWPTEERIELYNLINLATAAAPSPSLVAPPFVHDPDTPFEWMGLGTSGHLTYRIGTKVKDLKFSSRDDAIVAMGLISELARATRAALREQTPKS